MKNNQKKGVPGGSVKACIRRMTTRKRRTGRPKDPAALCAWIADQREPGWRKKRRTVKRKKNPDVDDNAVRELELFIDNDRELHFRQYIPIVHNLIKKKLKGTYDRTKAPKLFEYLMESGAKKYAKEFGGTWHQTFSPATRRAAARQYAAEFESEYRIGALDDEISKVAPVAYRGVPGSKIRKLADKGAGLPKARTKAQADKALLKNPRSSAKVKPKKNPKKTPKKNPQRMSLGRLIRLP